MKLVTISFLVLAALSSLTFFRFKQDGDDGGNTFRVVYDVIVNTPTNEFKFQGRRVRYVNKDGRMREVNYTPEGKEVSFMLYSFEGNFVGLPDKQQLSPAGPFQKPNNATWTAAFHAKASVGTASILGYVAQIRKTKDGKNEAWTCHQLGNTPLKTIFYNDGIAGCTIVEAVAIHWEYLPEEVFRKPDWQISTWWLENTIKGYEFNHRDTAPLQRELEKWRVKQ